MKKSFVLMLVLAAVPGLTGCSGGKTYAEQTNPRLADLKVMGFQKGHPVSVKKDDRFGASNPHGRGTYLAVLGKCWVSLDYTLMRDQGLGWYYFPNGKNKPPVKLTNSNQLQSYVKLHSC